MIKRTTVLKCLFCLGSQVMASMKTDWRYLHAQPVHFPFRLFSHSEPYCYLLKLVRVWQLWPVGTFWGVSGEAREEIYLIILIASWHTYLHLPNIYDFSFNHIIHNDFHEIVMWCPFVLDMNRCSLGKQQLKVCLERNMSFCWTQSRWFNHGPRLGHAFLLQDFSINTYLSVTWCESLYESI